MTEKQTRTRKEEAVSIKVDRSGEDWLLGEGRYQSSSPTYVSFVNRVANMCAHNYPGKRIYFAYSHGTVDRETDNTLHLMAEMHNRIVEAGK